jgi:hypothetical protein
MTIGMDTNGRLQPMKTSILVILIGLAIALAGSPASAQSCTTATCNAQGPSEAEFLAALPSSSNTNATVVVNIPSGTAGWSSQLVYTIPAAVTSLTIQGDTVVNCTGTPGTSNYSCTAADNTVIQDDYNSGNPLFLITTGNSSSKFRVTGITIQGGTANQSKNNDGLIQIEGNSQNMRWDHDDLDVSTYSAGGEAAIMRTTGAIAGVMDHNIFKNIYGSYENDIQVDGAIGDTIGNGDGTWANPTPWGSPTEFYLESNYFNGGYANDCAEAGAIVERYNTFVNISNALQTHATKSPAGPGRGCRSSEFYNNYIASCSTTPCDAAGGSKGGPQMAWGNILAAGQNWNEFWSICTDRNACESPETAPPNGWGSCGTENGTGSLWDGNQPTIATGYPCLDGLGRGQTQRPLNGANFPGRLLSVLGSVGWPQQYLEPMYLWMNTLNGKSELKIEDHVTKQNVDIYIDNANFNGTSGTGFGLLAARPSACTAGQGGTYYTSPTGSYGVAYFATDANSGQGELYACTSTNVWTPIYEPYTYPHPLVAGGASQNPPPNPPTGLTATVD